MFRKKQDTISEKKIWWWLFVVIISKEEVSRITYKTKTTYFNF
jgi:hypothetical protein